MSTNRVVYKYELTPNGSIQMPKNAQIIKIASQGDGIFVWAIVDPQNALETRSFLTIPTGIPFDQETVGWFRETVIFGDMVFHVFEKIP